MRTALGFTTQAKMATAVQKLMMDGTNTSRVSDWERGKFDAGSIAKVSLLHPRPVACLGWLREGGDMPRIHVDRDERSPGAGQDEVDDKRALRIIQAMQHTVAEVTDILTGRPKEEEDPRLTITELEGARLRKRARKAAEEVEAIPKKKPRRSSGRHRRKQG